MHTFFSNENFSPIASKYLDFLVVSDYDAAKINHIGAPSYHIVTGNFVQGTLNSEEGLLHT